MLIKDGMVLLLLVDCGCVLVYFNMFYGVVMNVWDSEFWNIVDWFCVVD